jgi:hypothetical protein
MCAMSRSSVEEVKERRELRQQYVQNKRRRKKLGYGEGDVG